MGQFKKAGNPQAYVFDPAVTIANGSLVRWDTTTDKAQPLGSSVNFNNFIGVAEFQNPMSSPLDNTGGNVSGLINMGLVRREGIFPFKTTVAESYAHGDAVKRGIPDDLTVSLDAGANEIIGYVNRPDGTVLVGAAGVNVDIEIQSNFGSTKILSA